MRAKVLLKDIGAKESDVKVRDVLKYSTTHPILKLRIKQLRVGEKTLNSNLFPKLRLTKKTFHVSFPNRLLKNA